MSEWDDIGGGQQLAWGRNTAGDERVLPIEGSALQVTFSDSGGALGSVDHTAETVGTAGSAVLAANASRHYALLVNDSDTHNVYIDIAGGAAGPNEGIRLNAGGGNYELSAANGNLWLGAISAAAGSAGSAVVLITEGQLS